MPRRPRLVVPQVPLHIIQRGNNRQKCFFTDSDYMVYLDLLLRGASKANCLVHAYVLMSNHIHVLATPADDASAGEMMKAVGERYVRYLNKHHGRCGTLWDGRFRSCLVEDETYLLVCHRYIELNPVRAGMVAEPSLYRWSSHRCNAYADTNELITPHPIVAQLGNDIFSRTDAYRALFSDAIKEQQLAALRDATNHNFVFGSSKFAETMADLLGRKVSRVETSHPQQEA